MPDFFEFFAGGGMARAGLGPTWRCLFANDFDHKKCDVYRKNWGGVELIPGDVRKVLPANLPGRPNLIWASFPCQDLSLAGAGAGLKGDRSGTFWPFWDIVRGLKELGRLPEILALENVCGTLTSHGGKDFSAIGAAFAEIGFRFGAMVIDASLFLPQSRPRLFLIGVRGDVVLPKGVVGEAPSSAWNTRSLLKAYDRLPQHAKDKWIWWNLPRPNPRASVFADLIEDDPSGVEWHTPSKTKQLLEMMSDVNLEKVELAKKASVKTKRRVVGGVYKRTRLDEDGFKVQRAEVRFDEVAGCLRTPAGGSSRQLILVIDGEKMQSRLISSRETARLMGLPESYQLPENYNEAYHLTGDGVAVPAVRHLAKFIFEPILAAQVAQEREFSWPLSLVNAIPAFGS